MIVLKSESELDIMRKGGRILADAIDQVIDHVRPGVETIDLDRIAEGFLRDHHAIPAFKGYRGFPGTICVSVNEEVVHGIPSHRKLQDGDIVSIDVGARFEGYYTDTAVTVPVGKISDEKIQLMAVTRKALDIGIQWMTPENQLSDLCSNIQKYIESRGYAVVKDFVGHGIGKELHEEPQIPNFGEPGHGPRIQVGMVFAIEPMVNIGTAAVEVNSDHWTVVTKDRKASAHFEHTVALTESGTEILTWRKMHT